MKDLRKFEVDPDVSWISPYFGGDPSTPSLKYGEIHDTSITSRAFARKGRGRGDILLPPGRKVATVVEETVTRAFRESGYRVVGMGVDARAVPVEVDINQFWAWLTPPGFSSVFVEFKASLQVRVPITGFDASAPVLGSSKIESKSFVYQPTWIELMTSGLDNLVTNLKARIPPP